MAAKEEYVMWSAGGFLRSVFPMLTERRGGEIHPKVRATVAAELLALQSVFISSVCTTIIIGSGPRNVLQHEAIHHR